MCGITGLIGESKKPQVSFELITHLFVQSEIRGDDAAGFWGAQKSGKIIYFKEPGKASDLIKKDAWKKLLPFNANLLLVHARGASAGVGPPAINKNNHPFTSTDKNIGLIHNGRVPDQEYELLKKKYEVASKCDSEILLRIIEGAEKHTETDIKKDFPDYELSFSRRLAGIKDVFSLTNRTHMAVAVGEKMEDDRHIWFFRNRQRSLWLVDLRKELGQVFFCSTPEIWWAALSASSAKFLFKSKVKLIELPEEEVWFLKTTKEQPVLCEKNVKKFVVNNIGTQTMWLDEKDQVKIIKKSPTTSVITNLDDNDEIMGKKTNQLKDMDADVKKPLSKVPSVIDVNVLCESMKKLLAEINSAADSRCDDGTLTIGEYNDLLSYLNQAKLELEGTLKILKV
jgi:hypothetical protein